MTTVNSSHRTESLIDIESTSTRSNEQNDQQPIKGYGPAGKMWKQFFGKSEQTHTRQLDNLREQASRISTGDGLAALNDKLEAKNWDRPTKLFSTNEMRTLMHEVRRDAVNYPMPVELIFPGDDDGADQDQTQPMAQAAAQQNQPLNQGMAANAQQAAPQNLHISGIPNEEALVHRDDAEQILQAARRQSAPPNQGVAANAPQAAPQRHISGIPNEHAFVHRDETANMRQAAIRPRMDADEVYERVHYRGDQIARTALTNYQTLQTVPALHQAVTGFMNAPEALGFVDRSQAYMPHVNDPQFGTNMSQGELTDTVTDLLRIGEGFCVAGSPSEITLRNNHQDAAQKQNAPAAMDRLEMSLLGGPQEKIDAIQHFINTQLQPVFNEANQQVQTEMEHVQRTQRDHLIGVILTVAADEIGAAIAAELQQGRQ